jgi:hypothetical protein
MFVGETHQGTNMTQMGPEALLMMSATARRSDVAEYARLEYRRAEAPRIEATLLSDFEAMHPKGAATRRIFSQALRLFKRGNTGQLSTKPAARAEAVGGAAMTEARVRSVVRPSLAALPAIQAGYRRSAGASPLSAVPTLGRA